MAKAPTIGTAVEVKEGGTVRRPDGTSTVVTGGTYILDTVGTYEIEGTEIEVKEA